jgi:16S rRNA (cytosine967-C5)-methyltransferase
LNAKSLIDQCALALAQVLSFNHPSDATLSKFFREHRYLGSRERSTVAETVFTVLRQRYRIEALARTAPKGMGSRERRMAILAFAGAQDFLLTGLSVPEKEWLLETQAIKDTDSAWGEGHRHNLPDWIAHKLRQQMRERATKSLESIPNEMGTSETIEPNSSALDEEFWSLSYALLQAAGLDVRVNTQLTKVDVVAEELKQAGLEFTPLPYSKEGFRLRGRPHLSRLAAFQEGRIEVQDEGSQLLAQLVGAKRGEMVADFCAGAGGKTLALGAQMRSTGRLYAFDVSAKRLDALKPRLRRSGLSNVHPVVIAHERDERIKRLYGKIDRVLVDAPCSGLGTLRRNPDMKWRLKERDIAELVEKQGAILRSAAKLLKVGGRLVYATCSLLREENEDLVQAFMQELSEGSFPMRLTLLDAGELLMQPQLSEDGCLRLWPHLHQTDGFFAAVWERVA